MTNSDAALLERIDRLESTFAIQQLPIRYALATDSRDLNAWVNLFPEDVDCGRHGVGREALRRYMDGSLRSFYRSIHSICGHWVEFIDSEHAKGVTYSRAEHEVGDKWIVQTIGYFDLYVRRGEAWFFVRRYLTHWYSTDWQMRPHAFPWSDWDQEGLSEATLPQKFPTWADFWSRSTAEELAALTHDPIVETGTRRGLPTDFMSLFTTS